MIRRKKIFVVTGGTGFIGSGISKLLMNKNYNVKINGKWMLFEYEYKKNELFYNFDSYFINKKKNLIEVSVEDMAGNKSQKNFIFYRN